MSKPTGAWGKRCDETGQTHLLEHHCADVAACFGALVADPVVRARFDRAAGGGGLDEVSLARLAVLAFFHDFGKVNSGFQFGRGTSARVGQSRIKFVGHIKASLWACRRWEVLEALGFPDLARRWGREAFEELLCASLAHHGRPASLRNASGAGRDNIWQPWDGYDPLAACATLLARSRRWFPRAFEPAPELRTTPALTHLFAGMVAIADQVGSNRDLFRFEPDADRDYIERARRRARDAVASVGLARAAWRDGGLGGGRPSSDDFATLFNLPSPRPLQTALANAPLDRPLMILESETGSGKTEAAIWRFVQLWRAGKVDGLYFALPTRAAATQIHQRVQRVIERVLPPEAEAETVLAIPGYLRAGDASGRLAGRFKVEWFDDPDARKRQARWSAESARKFLASPSAVGTVDQALMAGLMVKWAHFRGSALARSLLVVDEVHASDAYMTELLHSILWSHLEVGGHALLMSATLGSRARNQLAAQRPRGRADPDFSAAVDVPYPVVTMVGRRGEADSEAFEPTGYSRTVRVAASPIMQHPGEVARIALRAARQGAKVLVVRNTVKQARRVFAELLNLGGADALLRLAGGPALHHSRFAAEDRARLDRAVEEELGKGRRPGGRVVVGTQTLEQSLDIDADLLLTDLCPVDVLLQRIGRLHRHGDSARPDPFTAPRCVVLVPEGAPECFLDGQLLGYGIGISASGGGVYRDIRVAELTRRLVIEHPVWEIPEMNRILVEGGIHAGKFSELEDELGPAWSERGGQVEGTVAAERQVARGHRLTRGERFQGLQFPDLDERVRTRLGDTGPRIKLAEPRAGPFGLPVETFSLPGHWFRGESDFPSKRAIDGATAEPTAEGLILRIGPSEFAYDRTGLRRRS